MKRFLSGAALFALVVFLVANALTGAEHSFGSFLMSVTEKLF